MTATLPSWPGILVSNQTHVSRANAISNKLTLVEFLKHGWHHLVDFGEDLLAAEVGGHDCGGGIG